MAETESKKVLTIDTGKSVSSVKDLKDRLKELKDVLVSTEQGTVAYSKAMQEAADIQHTLKETTAELNSNAMDFGQVMNNSVNAVKGMVGAMQSAQAVMTLFGVESEDTAKAIQKMQASMALIQGITAFESGVKSINRLLPKLLAGTKAQTIAQKALTAAMTPKGILVLSAAITGLTLAYNALVTSQEKAEKKQKELEKQITDSNVRMAKSYDKLNKAISQVGTKTLPTLQAEYSRAEYQFSKIAKTKYGWSQKDVEMFIKYIKNYNEAIRTAAKSTNEADAKTAMMTANAWMSVIGTQVKGKNDLYEWGNQLLALDEDILNAQQKKNDEAKKEVDNLKEAHAIAKDILRIESMTSAQRAAYNASVKPVNKPTEVTEEQENDTEDEERIKRNVELYKWMNETIISEEDRLTRQYIDNLKLLQESEDSNLITHQQFLEKKAQLDKEYSSKATEEVWKQVSTYSQLANSVGSSISSIADLYAEVNSENGEVSKEVLERQKGMQIAGTIVSTLGAIAQMTNSVWSSPDTGEFWAKLALQIAMTTEMLASMGVSIAQIKNTSIGSTGASYSVSSGAMSTLNTPTVYTKDVQGSMINSNIRDSRVYVVESDITRTQNRVSVTESENRY